MKGLYHFYLILLFASFACGINESDRSSKLKEHDLNQREQELLAREESLQHKEDQLLAFEKMLDSVSIRLQDSSSTLNKKDTLSVLIPDLEGLYDVTMRCTETNCIGSAVGDVKNEQWHINYEHNSVIIDAMADRKIVRKYKGNYLGGTIELEAQPDSVTTSQAGKMIVRLQLTKDKGLDGVREITRPDDCRIIYDLDLKKQ